MTEQTPRMMEADEYKARVDGDAAALRVIDELQRSLARRDALLREISREISWDEKVGDYWKRRIERELEKK
jgi:hypothetical protein